MHARELEHILEAADLERLERLKDVVVLLVEDVRLVRHAHGTFLPAARDYLRGRDLADHRLRDARIRRARLGGASRWLYDHQRRTFEKAIALLCPLPVPPALTRRIWRLIQQAEVRLLRRSRRASRG